MKPIPVSSVESEEEDRTNWPSGRRSSASSEVVFADLRDQAVPTVAGRTVRAAYTTGTTQLITDAFARASGRRDIAPPLVDIQASDYVMSITRRLVEIVSAKSTALAADK